jgi:catechol 2,3-dioxygenase-like lactoylglutathione lyase family enzyme
MSVHHVAKVSIPVSDPDRAKVFYCDKLGFEVRSESSVDEKSREQRWVELVPPGAQTSLTLVTWFASMPPGSLQGLVLEAANLDAAVEQLRSKSVKTGNVENAPWGRYVTLKDPDGNGLVLQQSGEQGKAS